MWVNVAQLVELGVYTLVIISPLFTWEYCGTGSSPVIHLKFYDGYSHPKNDEIIVIISYVWICSKCYVLTPN